MLAVHGEDPRRTPAGRRFARAVSVRAPRRLPRGDQARQRSITSGGLAWKSAQKSAPNARTPASDTVSGTH
ncbi:hypothetical protein GCM10010423_31930 [Streptomyces levis]|uniref:Uncharacterized protein n=1 Tax=Streptomyces levis TaxID=285566 RepID=A0ABN3NSB5_9ACTN